MNVTVGGQSFPASFTALDMRDLGKAGVMRQLAKMPELEGWERLDAMASFISACIRRAGGKMTADELLLVLKPEEREALFGAIPDLLGIPKEEGAGPNGASPGSTATST